MTKTRMKKKSFEDRLGAVLGRSWVDFESSLGVKEIVFSIASAVLIAPRRVPRRPKIAPRRRQDDLEEVFLFASIFVFDVGGF